MSESLITGAQAESLDTAADPGRAAADPLPPLADFHYEDKSTWIAPAVISGFVRGAEFIIVAAIGYVIFLSYVGLNNSTQAFSYLVSALVAAGLTMLVFQTFQLYDLAALSRFGKQFVRLATAWSIVFGGLMVVAFFAKIGPEFSRVWLASWYGYGLLTLCCFRAAVAGLVQNLSKSGRLVRRAVVVGGGSLGESLIDALEASDDTDIRICGIFDDRGDDRISSDCAGYPLLGKVDELIEFGRKTRIDLLIVALPVTAEKRVLQLLKKLWVLPVDIRLAAHTNALQFRPRTYSYIGNVPFIDVFDKPIASWDHVTKWLFDRIVGTLAFIVASPIMLLTALAVKIDSPGPVFFKQKRHGFNNELIEIYKFRSMYVDQSDSSASKLVTKDDPRVTPVGRIIRKTSLDELPQLINVVKGELSLVGPRPHALAAKADNALYADVVESYFARHRVKPGITGWAQINGWRGETDTPEKIQRRVEHDLYYIENWSVLLDFYILIKTPFALLDTKNAY